MRPIHLVTFLITALLIPALLPAQVPYERLVNAENEPESWLTYSGTYTSHRFSGLDWSRL